MPVSTSLSSPKRAERAALSLLRPCGREAEAEARDGRGVDAALGEIVARVAAIDALQLLGEPALRRGHDVGQVGRALGLVAGARVGGGDLHPGLARQLLDRVHERQAAGVGQEADRVAMRAAAEAMVEALLVVDREARRLLACGTGSRL